VFPGYKVIHRCPLSAGLFKALKSGLRPFPGKSWYALTGLVIKG
jgi:hypothetical protein